MPKTTKLIVYSAMTEAQTLRQFAAGAVVAERDGYVPIEQSWDRNTLTVTYDLRGEGSPGPSGHEPATSPSVGVGTRLRRRMGLAFGSS